MESLNQFLSSGSSWPQSPWGIPTQQRSTLSVCREDSDPPSSHCHHEGRPAPSHIDLPNWKLGGPYLSSETHLEPLRTTCIVKTFGKRAVDKDSVKLVLTGQWMDCLSLSMLCWHQKFPQSLCIHRKEKKHLKQYIPPSNVDANHLGISLEWGFWLARSALSLRSCVSNKLWSNAGAAGHKTRQRGARIKRNPGNSVLKGVSWLGLILWIWMRAQAKGTTKKQQTGEIN